ncbi:M16 family metallopeptidase [Bacteroidota bacterium]
MDTVIDRKIQPKSHSFDKIKFVKPLMYKLDNGINLHTFDSGEQDLVKIEMIFPAGLWYQTKPLIAHATNNLISNGTIDHSANQLAELIDFYGAYLETNIGKDNAYIVLYCLNKHLNVLLPILEEIVKYPIFPEEEIQLYQQKYKQQFIINNEKVNYLAKTHFNELIFGNDHPYGRMLKLDDFNNISRNDLIQYHKQQYNSENIQIIIAGKFTKMMMKALNNYFGSKDWLQKNSVILSDLQYNSSAKQTKFIEKNNAVQSAVRIGRMLFKKTHKDYAGMQVLNTIIGGYFGSRLMKNIREDKGYTYGIGSSIITFKNAGYFFISTETGVAVTAKAIDEIYKEINRIKETKVIEEELDLVKNYMLGSVLRSQDGPFVIAENYRDLIENGLNNDYYTEYIKSIKNIKASDIIELANKYLSTDSITELVVGKFEKR